MGGTGGGRGGPISFSRQCPARHPHSQMDIEGFEFEVVAALESTFKASGGKTRLLPQQVSMEVHHTDVPDLGDTLSAAQLGSLFRAMATMGYSVIMREDNIICPHCSEFTFLRTAC